MAAMPTVHRAGDAGTDLPYVEWGNVGEAWWDPIGGCGIR